MASIQTVLSVSEPRRFSSATDASDFTGLWVTDGTPGRTEELGGLENGQIVGASATLSPENLTAFDNSVLFDGNDSTEFQGLWITDGTTAGTVEIGGPQERRHLRFRNSRLSTPTTSSRSGALPSSTPRTGRATPRSGSPTAQRTEPSRSAASAMPASPGPTTQVLETDLLKPCRFGDRIFFSGADNDSADRTLDDGRHCERDHGSRRARRRRRRPWPTSELVGADADRPHSQRAAGACSTAKTPWASKNCGRLTARPRGTYEIGGEGVGGALAGEASNGVNPSSIVSLGNGKAVFIGDDDSNNQAFRQAHPLGDGRDVRGHGRNRRVG